MIAPGAPTDADDLLDEFEAVAALTAVKPAITTRTNTVTLAADPHLFASLRANLMYRLDGFIIFTGTTTADFKVDMTLPSGATFDANVTTFNATSSVGAQGLDQRMWTTGQSLALPAGGVTFPSQRQQMGFTGVVQMGANAGNAAIRWSQNGNPVGTPEASNVAVYTGSWIRFEEIGS